MRVPGRVSFGGGGTVHARASPAAPGDFASSCIKRWGDIFPLPVFRPDEHCSAVGSRTERRRAQRLRGDLLEASETASALNVLSGFSDPSLDLADRSEQRSTGCYSQTNSSSLC